MHKRHTLHGAAQRTNSREGSLSSAPPGESGTRIKGAYRRTDADEGIQASLEAALLELDSLEMPFRASAPPLASPPAQQMPRGMPPLPFTAPHPAHMPPLPSASLSGSPPEEEPPRDESPIIAAAPARPGPWLPIVALAIGLVCLALAFWLRSR